MATKIIFKSFQFWTELGEKHYTHFSININKVQKISKFNISGFFKKKK